MDKTRVVDRRRTGWSRVDNKVIDEYGAELGVYGVAVYAVLVRRASQEDSAIVTINNLAKTLGCSRTSIKTALNRLIACGVIDVSYRRSGAYQHANEYGLLDVDVPLEQRLAWLENEPQKLSTIVDMIPRSKYDPGRHATPPGQNTTAPRSKYDHLKKDTVKKDSLEKDGIEVRKMLKDAMVKIRMSSLPVSQMVAMDLLDAEIVEALEKGGYRRELESIAAERAPAPRPDRIQ